MNDNCIFCKIVNKETTSKAIFEDDNILAFNDVKPIAPIHVLIIPKKHISSIVEIEDSDSELIGNMVLRAKKIADDMGMGKDGYKLLFRIGEHGGQEIPHIHLHLIGGADLYEEIRPR